MLLSQAVNLANKCRIAPPPAERISVQFISNIYNRICLPYLEEPPTLPDLSLEPREHLTAILDSLSCDFLNMELDPLLYSEDILSGNEESLSLLLRIFDSLYDCLSQSASVGDEAASTSRATENHQEKASSQGPSRFGGPTFKGKPIGNLRSASVIYSPRTDALRRLKRARSDTRGASRKNVPTTKSSRSKFGKEEAAKKRKLDAGKAAEAQGRIEHNHVMRPSYHQEAGEKRRMRIAVERAKAAIRNKAAERRHVLAMTTKTMDAVLKTAVSNDMKLETVKEKVKNATREQNSRISSLRRRLRVIGERGDSENASTSRERANKCKEIRSLLSELPSRLLC